MQNLTPLQRQYLKDCELLQSLGYEDNLFDSLYLTYAKTKKETN
jgi:hypothetical protein